MRLVFAEGKADLDRARQSLEECVAEFETDPWLANTQSIANYVLPRESNGFEGYPRFPIPQEDNYDGNEKNELRIYFSPRALQCYRIIFVHRTSEGKCGFDVSQQIGAQKIAAQFHTTGVFKREVEKPVYGNEPLDD